MFARFRVVDRTNEVVRQSTTLATRRKRSAARKLLINKKKGGERVNQLTVRVHFEVQLRCLASVHSQLLTSEHLFFLTSSRDQNKVKWRAV